MKQINSLSLALITVLLSACSMTKNIPEDDQLFVGLKSIVYVDEQKDSFASHKTTMKEERN